jgi:hypothetical protein
MWDKAMSPPPVSLVSEILIVPRRYEILSPDMDMVLLLIFVHNSLEFPSAN